MPQEFHLHADLLEESLVVKRSSAQAAPCKMSRRFSHDAVHRRCGKKHRRANIVHVGDHLRAAGLYQVYQAVDFAGNAHVASVAREVKNDKPGRGVAQQVFEQIAHFGDANLFRPDKRQAFGHLGDFRIQGHAHYTREPGRIGIAGGMVPPHPALREVIVEESKCEIVVPADGRGYRKPPFVIAVEGHLQTETEPVEAQFQEEPVVLEIFPVVADREALPDAQCRTETMDALL